MDSVVESTDDQFVQLAEQGIATLAEAAVPGKWIVDILPFSEHRQLCAIRPIDSYVF